MLPAPVLGDPSGPGERGRGSGARTLRDPQPCAGLRVPHGPCGEQPFPLEAPRLPCGCTAALGFVSPSRKWESSGWRWLRARSRLGRALMQTERHRESCSEGSGRILTCLSATVSRLSLFPSKPRAAIAVAAVEGDAGAVRRLLSPAVDLSRGREGCLVRSFPAWPRDEGAWPSCPAPIS